MANDALELAERLFQKTDQLLSAVPEPSGEVDLDFCSRCVAERYVVRAFEQMGGLYATIAKLTINRAMEESNDLCTVE